MLSGINITGTNLNRSMSADLSTANKLYQQQAEEQEGFLSSVLSLVKGVLTLDIDKILGSLGNIVDLGLDLVGDVKDRILSFIYSLLGRDSSGLSKLSLTERSNLTPHNGCNFNMGNLNGMNLNIAGYSIASLLAMLLCAGISGIFSLIDGIIDIGLATVNVVTGAISDVLKFITGGDTLNVVNDLSNSKYANQLTKVYNDPSNMLLGAVGKNTSNILNPSSAFGKLSDGMDNMAPSWLGGDNFNLSKVRGNRVVSDLASARSINRVSSPITNSYNTNKIFSSAEKISMFGNSSKNKWF